MIASRAERAAVVGLFLLAAAYFVLGSTLTLEWTDEGQIIYPSWRVAHGALPYRDFRHGYGPSTFLWNGALFYLLGDDLIVIRASLVVIKALVATLVYVLTRGVTTPGFALAAYLLLVPLWGGPWWIFNAPYANHYGIALSLLGLCAAMFLRRFWIACAVAGLCFGAAATFKQTNGIFSFIAFAVFLVSEPYLIGQTDAGARSNARGGGRAVASLRLAVYVGTLAACLGYAVQHADPWTYGALLTPVVVTMLVLIGRTVRQPWAGDAARAIGGLAAAMLGAAIPVGGIVLFYASADLLAAFTFNLTELLRRMTWFEGLPTPPLRASLIVVTVLLAYGALVSWRGRGGPTNRRPYAALVLTAAMTVSGALTVAADPAWGGWYGDAFRVMFFVPFVVVAASLIWLAGPSAAFWNPAAEPDATLRARVGLLHVNAVVGLLYLYPAADFWHVTMMWPIYLPLAGYQLRCVHAAAGSHAVRRASVALLAVVLLGVSGPQIYALAAGRANRQQSAPFERADAITGSAPKSDHAAGLVQQLDALDPERRPLLVLVNEQMLYFLTGRVSAMDGDEFTLYLIQAGFISPPDGRALLPESRIIERLDAIRPRVIDIPDSKMSARFYATYPGVADYLRAHYVLEATVGDYRVLRSKDAPPDGIVPDNSPGAN